MSVRIQAFGPFGKNEIAQIGTSNSELVARSMVKGLEIDFPNWIFEIVDDLVPEYDEEADAEGGRPV